MPPRMRPWLIVLTLVLVAVSLLWLHPSTRSQLGSLSSSFPKIYQPRPYILSTPQGGIVTVEDPGTLSRHPILDLIERGHRRHAEIQTIRSNVQTLKDAIKDYRRAFNMDPPEGFDEWHRLSIELNATTAPSLIPLAHTTLLPFLSLPPALLRQRVKKALPLRAMCGIVITPENATHPAELIELDDVSGRRVTPLDWAKMIEQDAGRLPKAQNEQEPVVLAIWADDSAFRMADGDIVQESSSLALAGKVWEEAELARRETEAEQHLSWTSTCSNWEQQSDQVSGNDTFRSPKRFVADLEGATDYCRHPELLAQNGELIMRQELPTRPLQPVMVIGRPLHGIDIIGPPTQMTQKIVEYPIFWADKTDDRLLYRGQISGIYHIDRYQWRQGPRDRLAFMVNEEQPVKRDILIERSTSVERESWGHQELVQRYLDIGLVNENIDWHCGLNGAQQFACRIDDQLPFSARPGTGRACQEMLKEHKWKERVSPEEAQKYKFILDVDGYGWSSRWRKELSSGSAIIKTTIYNEWWTARAVPWYHFIPSLYDYSDLFDIMAFFTGSPDGTNPGRDDLAEEIGQRGRKFALDNLRWEDMRSYMFLLLLEYRRAWSDDRTAATYKSQAVM